MNKFKKKNLLVEVAKPLVVRHPKTDKHNEVTVVVLSLAIPLKELGVPISPGVIKAVKKVAVSFPDAGLYFNFKAEAPAFIFTVKAKTERRGDDTPNQELADRIVMAKANSKACVIAKRILGAIVKYYEKEIALMNNVCEVLSNTSARELAYIQKV